MHGLKIWRPVVPILLISMRVYDQRRGNIQTENKRWGTQCPCVPPYHWSAWINIHSIWDVTVIDPDIALTCGDVEIEPNSVSASARLCADVRRRAVYAHYAVKTNVFNFSVDVRRRMENWQRTATVRCRRVNAALTWCEWAPNRKLRYVSDTLPLDGGAEFAAQHRKMTDK